MTFSSMSSRLVALGVSLWLIGALTAPGVAPSQTRDLSALEQAGRALVAFLDSENYASTTSWSEHVLLSYRLAAGRDPSVFEFFQLSSLHADNGFPPSGVFSYALRQEAPRLTWHQLDEFLASHSEADFTVDAAIREAAIRLESTPVAALREEIEALHLERSSGWARAREPVTLPLTEPWLAGTEYEIYYGYLHGHSELSDGEGDADDAYAHARDVGGLDYFGLTDHSEYLILFPWERRWDELKDAANDANQPGTFATLWGFEWSSPVQGHINVINSSTLTEVISDPFLGDVYEWILARSGVFGRFNHPGRYDDLLIEFRHLEVFPGAVGRMVAIETFNKNQGFDDFHYDCEWLFCGSTYLDEGNTKGWFIGAAGGQDNHSADWGNRNSFRTAVLATELTREAVLEAYQRRRLYATEDEDLELDVRVDGFPMGSRLAGAVRDFEVSACDASGDEFEEVRLYRNGSVIETRSVTGNCIAETLSDPGAVGSDYYYVIVRQTDDSDGNGRNDEAITSPFWLD